MDELGFTLAGFAVLGVLHYAVAIVFAVSEYRKWRPTGWIIPLAVVMFVAFSFIFPVVEHIVRPRMRACGVDRRIIRLKLVLDRKSTRLNSSHNNQSRMPSSA